MALNIQISEATYGCNRELTANGVCIGVVSDIFHQLLWSVGVQSASQVKFSIRDTERLSKILDALVEYKNANGYEDVIIRNCTGDVGTFFSREEWDKIGYELSETGDYYRTKRNY